MKAVWLTCEGLAGHCGDELRSNNPYRDVWLTDKVGKDQTTGDGLYGDFGSMC